MRDTPPETGSASLDALYKRIILEHNRAPRNARLPEDHHRVSARGFDALCGDDIRVAVMVDDEIIRQAGFEGQACAVTTASASLMTEWVRGQPVARVLAAGRCFRELLDDPDRPDEPALGEINQLRSVAAFPSRVRNALLPWKTLEAALAGREECGINRRKAVDE